MPHYESSGDFVVQDNNVVIKSITMDNNTYINHSKFIEFIDELAIQFTEKEFGEETYKVGKEDVLMYQKDAHNYYNEKYDEIETMANKIMGLYTDNDKPRKAILEQQALNRKIAEKEDKPSAHTEYYRICSKCEGENTHNIDDFGFCKHCLAHL